MFICVKSAFTAIVDEKDYIYSSIMNRTRKIPFPFWGVYLTHRAILLCAMCIYTTNRLKVFCGQNTTSERYPGDTCGAKICTGPDFHVCPVFLILSEILRELPEYRLSRVVSFRFCCLFSWHGQKQDLICRQLQFDYTYNLARAFFREIFLKPF